MKKLLPAICAATAAVCLSLGCGGEELPPDRGGTARPSSTPAPAMPEPTSGDPESLGMGKVGDFFVEAIQRGDVEPGRETQFEMIFQGDVPLNSLKLWIGDKEATISEVSKASKVRPGLWSGKAKGPEKISQFSELWLEIARPSGASVVGSLKLRLKGGSGS